MQHLSYRHRLIANREDRLGHQVPPSRRNRDGAVAVPYALMFSRPSNLW
jgi:hypothetical protein